MATPHDSALASAAGQPNQPCRMTPCAGSFWGVQRPWVRSEVAGLQKLGTVEQALALYASPSETYAALLEF